MARYKMQDGTIVDTQRATQTYQEAEDWDGHNMVSRNTRSEWEHQALSRSRRGRYYVEHWSQWEGSLPWAEWVSPEEAARWLDLNEKEMPEELLAAAEKVRE